MGMIMSLLAFHRIKNLPRNLTDPKRQVLAPGIPGTRASNSSHASSRAATISRSRGRQPERECADGGAGDDIVGATKDSLG